MQLSFVLAYYLESKIWTFLVCKLDTIHCILENSRKLTAKKEKAAKDKASEGYSISLKEWRQAFRGQYRAPWYIPKTGGKYKMCPK